MQCIPFRIDNETNILIYLQAILKGHLQIHEVHVFTDILSKINLKKLLLSNAIIKVMMYLILVWSNNKDLT